MIWWIVGLVVVIAVLGFVLQRRGASSSGEDGPGMHDAGATLAPEAFRNRPEGTGGMSGGIGS